MAQLQGYFVQHKLSPENAIKNIPILFAQMHRDSIAKDGGADAAAPPHGHDEEEDVQRSLAFKRAARGKLTAAEVDRMVFNPQPGWEAQCNMAVANDDRMLSKNSKY